MFQKLKLCKFESFIPNRITIFVNNFTLVNSGTSLNCSICNFLEWVTKIFVCKRGLFYKHGSEELPVRWKSLAVRLLAEMSSTISFPIKSSFTFCFLNCWHKQMRRNNSVFNTRNKLGKTICVVKIDWRFCSLQQRSKMSKWWCYQTVVREIWCINCWVEKWKEKKLQRNDLVVCLPSFKNKLFNSYG